MKRTPKKREAIAVPSDVKIILKPVIEPIEQFLTRTDLVQDILIRLILLARKNGRPKSAEENYEEAA
jgi:hypothetical protein